MSLLSAVTVTVGTIVKVVAAVGIVGTGLALGATALSIMGLDLFFGPCTSGLTPDNFIRAGLSGIGYVASIAGWHFGTYINGQAQVVENKARYEAELERLQGAPAR